MADTDAARIGDVKGGLAAARADTATRLKRDGSNVNMTSGEAAAFRAAIGASGGGGGSGDVAGPTGATADSLAQFDGATGKLLKAGPILGVAAAGSVPTRADADTRYLLASLLAQANGVASLGSDSKIPTSQLPDAVLGALKYQSTWNATTNTPAIPAAAAGNKGWYYVVSVAGTTSIGGITDWEIGDWLVSNGTAWQKIDNTDQVVSVAGLKGIITAAALKTALAIAIADVAGLQAALDAKLTAANMAALKPPEFFTVAVSDEATAITTGTAKVTFRMPYGFTLTGVRASLTTASTSGLPQVAIKENGTTILSTNITIDVSEKTSTTAATPPVISDVSLADDAEITIDIVAAGTGAKGLKVTFLGSRT